LAPGGMVILVVPLTFVGISLILCALAGVPKLGSHLVKHGDSAAWRAPCACVAAGFCLSWAIYFALQGCLHGHLVFVHIPKNAGTSIEIAGITNGINWGSMHLEFAGYQTMPDNSSCSRYHVPPRLLPQPNPYTHGSLFCLTRSPYDRAVSEYKYLLSADWGKEYATTYSTGLYERPECSAAGLNHFVQTALKAYRSGQMYIDDCHHVPQVEYVYDKDGTQLCKHVLRIEDLPMAFDELMEEHGYPVRLPDTREGDTLTTCTDLSTKDLSAETRAMILEVYRDDFRRLNYSTAI